MQGEESVIGEVPSTAENVERRFFRRFEGPGVEAAHDMLRHQPIDTILFGYAVRGAMVAAIADRTDAFCPDAVVMPAHVAIVPVVVIRLALDSGSSLKAGGGR